MIWQLVIILLQLSLSPFSMDEATMNGHKIFVLLNSHDLKDWTANKHLIVTWINLTIKPKLRSNISHKEITKDLWDHIKKWFSLKTGACYQQLRASLTNCRQVGSSIEYSFGKKIWDSIVEGLSTKTCRCEKCNYNLVMAQETELKSFRSMIFSLA